jgi:hypothetical protein
MPQPWLQSSPTQIQFYLQEMHCFHKEGSGHDSAATASGVEEVLVP